MNNKFDELAKGLAQSVTRRQALRRFGVGLAAAVLASVGIANKAEAYQHDGGTKACNHCRYPYGCEKLPQDQQAGCITYCNGLCGSY